MIKLMYLSYLAAIVTANLTVAAFGSNGPWVSVATAFMLIGLNITFRDRLHDAWQGPGLKWKMGSLIVTGSLISYMINQGAARIAVASSLAFLASEAFDTAVYQVLKNRGWKWLGRVNGSNAVSATVDSFLFPTLAFGGFMPVITGAQIVAKIGGGYIWSRFLVRFAAVAALLLFVAAPARGQFISAGVGVVETRFSTNLAVEAVVAAMPVAGFRPNVIASWTQPGGTEPVLIPQVGYDLISGSTTWGIDAGCVGGPFDSYKDWRPSVTLRAIRYVGGPWKAIALASSDPTDYGRSFTFVLKVDRTIKFIR